jgi:hypothetical protein
MLEGVQCRLGKDKVKNTSDLDCKRNWVVNLHGKRIQITLERGNG